MKLTRIAFVLFILTSNFLFPQSSDNLEWAEGIVWYQIFPERFANGDTSNDPEAFKVFINSAKDPENWKVKEWTSNWFEQDEWEKDLGGNFRNHIFERRYGGDLQGVINRLDYLKKLGVGAIYFNPVFEAVSLHKYDGSTFHHIDVNFGPDPEGDRKLIEEEIPNDPATWKWTSADKLFLELLEEAKERDIRIVIDGVFNHTGREFFAFKDILENQDKSEYKDWYKINSFDDPITDFNEFDYEGWWGVKSLPEFNQTENDLYPGPKEYIFNSTKRWMDPNNDGDPSDGIDGWRLDVAREVPIGFWHQWSDLVKNINPEAIIIGELWELSGDFISEDGPFDALMNYNFAFAIKDFFINKSISANELVEKLEEIDQTYPEDNLLLLQNLLVSHDTERLSSLIYNPARDYDRDGNEGNPDYNPGKPTNEIYKQQKLIAAFQFTYPGAPMIYYGDEVGMWGADDPHCRKPMVWDDLKYDYEVIDESSGFRSGHGTYEVKVNSDLHQFYSNLIDLHNEHEALITGKTEWIFGEEEKSVLGFKRYTDDETLLIVLNNGNEDYTISTEKFKTQLEIIFSLNNVMLNQVERTLMLPTGSFVVIREF